MGLHHVGTGVPPRNTIDCFQALRKNWMQHIVTQRLDKQLMDHFAGRRDSPPFRQSKLEEFLEAQGKTPEW